MHEEVDLGTEEQIMTTPKIQELTTDEQRDESVWPDSQNTIPDELLPSLNFYSSKSIIVHPSSNRELQTPVQKLRIRRPSKFKESPYTMKFGSAFAMLGSEGKDARRKFANEDEYKQWIKQGNGYGNGFLISDLRRAEALKDIDLPIGAPPEYHCHFADLWMCYSRQLLSTNVPTSIDLCYVVQYRFHKYELLKIEKGNLRETAYAEYFMTVKVRNLTLGTVVETFHIHAGQRGIAQRNGDESVTEWRWNEWHLNSNCRFTLSIRFLNFVVVENISVSVFALNASSYNEVELWHRRLGHLHVSKMRVLVPS
ncbi:hypothetical protein CQW23_29309 [Capsicum baccatum]|uniref:GAG-pre-integrase domain-containing protein n=1 Tax=Capsicum baccatum TaxID=33114 RepID=A0A2G2VJ29_CAPBA|nr:hypothetical protein CQW23_29309 [Capsicum baccatum]